ncbi:MAG: cytidine deaminase, partial [Flavobacteriales bacterium]|nr:cytidine deaminase [Flavobacteriales bacterium]
MKHKEIQIKIAVYREGEAPPVLADLLQKAHQALPNAYAPYSHYRVAAAVLMENGEVVTGTNQENMAYPSGLCAERVAIFAAGSQYPGMKMVAVAIVAT